MQSNGNCANLWRVTFALIGLLARVTLKTQLGHNVSEAKTKGKCNQSTKSRLQNSDGGDGHHLSTVYRNVFPQLTFEGSY